MAEMHQTKRARKERVWEGFLVGKDSDAVLGLLTSDGNHQDRLHPVICVIASRIVASNGQLVCEQRPSLSEPQELRMANMDAGEKQLFEVRLKNPRARLCWVEAKKVGTDLVKHFRHLLHMSPHVREHPIPGTMLMHACLSGRVRVRGRKS